VVSSAPLALLLGEILPDTGSELSTLIPATSSMHHPSLRPSERRALSQADAVVWLGAQLEPGLVRYMAQVPAERLLTIGDLASLQLIAVQPGGQTDGHVWLSPDNAVLIARTVARELHSRKLLGDSVVLQAENFINLLEKQVRDYRAALNTIDDKSFIAIHDSFGYLAHYFDLHQIGFLVDANDQAIGLKAMWSLQQRIPPNADLCLLSSPQYSNSQSKALRELTRLHEQSIDIMASNYMPARGQYLKYLDDILAAVQRCLSANRSSSTNEKKPALNAG
jgi:zinc transport system substrate-binding protein